MLRKPTMTRQIKGFDSLVLVISPRTLVRMTGRSVPALVRSFLCALSHSYVPVSPIVLDGLRQRFTATVHRANRFRPFSPRFYLFIHSDTNQSSDLSVELAAPPRILTIPSLSAAESLVGIITVMVTYRSPCSDGNSCCGIPSLSIFQDIHTEPKSDTGAKRIVSKP